MPDQEVLPRLSRLSVALVVTGGGIWVLAAALYSAQLVSCFSCGSVVVAPGIPTTGYPVSAIHSLAWADLYANVYVATVGALSIAIGLTGFRRREMWAWYAVLLFVLSGTLTAFLDYLSWGGWYTFLLLGFPQLVGLIFATPGYFRSHASGAGSR